MTRAIVACLVACLHWGRNVVDYSGSAKAEFKTSSRVSKLLGKAKQHLQRLGWVLCIATIHSTHIANCVQT